MITQWAFLDKLIHKVEIPNVNFSLVTIHLPKQNSYLRVRENKRLPTKEALEEKKQLKRPWQNWENGGLRGRGSSPKKSSL